MFKKLIIGGLSLVLLGLSTVPSQAFQIKKGDELEYKVIVKSLIHGGDQTLKVVNACENYQGAEVIRIRSAVNTVGIVKQLTGYSETEEMLLDADGLYPVYLKREVKSGKNTEVEEVRFDYRKKIALRRYVENSKPEERTEIQLPGIVHDGLSLQVFLRKPDLKLGKHRLYFYSNGSGSIEEIDYSVRVVNQTLKVENKSYPEYLQVQSPQANITVLVSNDEARYPVLIRKITNFGKFEAKLANVR